MFPHSKSDAANPVFDYNLRLIRENLRNIITPVFFYNNINLIDYTFDLVSETFNLVGETFNLVGETFTLVGEVKSIANEV